MLHVAYFFLSLVLFVFVPPRSGKSQWELSFPVCSLGSRTMRCCWGGFRCLDEMAPERLHPWPPWRHRRLALGGVHSTSSLCARRGPSPLHPARTRTRGTPAADTRGAGFSLALPGYSWLWRHGGSWLVAASCWHPRFSCRPSCHCVV